MEQSGCTKPSVIPPVKSEQLPAEKKLTKDLVLAKSKAGSLVEIKKIVIWGQKITDCSIVTEIPDLEVASMTANRITSLEHFGQCPNLKELYLRNNSISELSQIYHLRDLPNLQILWLAGNPCTRQNNYRCTVIRNLEQLQTLDDSEVTPAERELSESDGLLFEEPPAPPTVETDAEEPPTPEPPIGDDPGSETTSSDEAANASISSAAASTADALPEAPAPVQSSVASSVTSFVSTSATSSAATADSGCQLPRYAMTEVRTAVLRLIRLLDNESLQLVMHAMKSRLDSGGESACGLDNL